MKFDKSGNGKGLDDLYILPESEKERKAIETYLNEKGVDYRFTRSDVKGQDWYNKFFFLAAFAESHKAAIETLDISAS